MNIITFFIIFCDNIRNLHIMCNSNGTVESISFDGKTFCSVDLIEKFAVRDKSIQKLLIEINEYARFYHEKKMKKYKSGEKSLFFRRLLLDKMWVLQSLFTNIKDFNEKNGKCHMCCIEKPLKVFLECPLDLKSNHNSLLSMHQSWNPLANENEAGFCKDCFSNWARSTTSDQYQEISDFWAHTCSTNCNVRKHYEPGVGLTDAEFDVCPMCFTWQNERLQIFNNSYNTDLVDKEFRNVGRRVENGILVTDAIKLVHQERPSVSQIAEDV